MATTPPEGRLPTPLLARARTADTVHVPVYAMVILHQHTPTCSPRGLDLPILCSQNRQRERNPPFLGEREKYQDFAMEF
ncbi:hypothetical protein BST61_g9550 [Cercospora zeina]